MNFFLDLTGYCSLPVCSKAVSIHPSTPQWPTWASSVGTAAGRPSLLGSTLMQRFALHQASRSSTSGLRYILSLLEISPTTAVSSAHITAWVLGIVAEQAQVSRVYTRGLTTNPSGELVMKMTGERVVPWVPNRDSVLVSSFCVSEVNQQRFAF